MAQVSAELTLEIAKFKESLAKASAEMRAFKATATGSAAQASKAINAEMGKVKPLDGANVMAGLAVAGGMAVVAASAVKGLINEFDRMNDIAKALNAPAESIQRIGFMAKMSGTDLERVTTAFHKMNRTAGGENGSEAFEKMGLNAKEFLALAPEKQIVAFAAAFQKMEGAGKGLQAQSAAFKLFGRAAGELFPLLRSSAEELQKLSEQEVVGEDKVKAMAAFNDNFDRLITSLKVLAAGPIGDATKQINEMLTAFEGLNDDYDGITGMMKQLDAVVSAGDKAKGIIVIDSMLTAIRDKMASFGPMRIFHGQELKDLQAMHDQLLAMKADYDAFAEGRSKKLGGDKAKADADAKAKAAAAQAEADAEAGANAGVLAAKKDLERDKLAGAVGEGGSDEAKLANLEKQIADKRRFTNGRSAAETLANKDATIREIENAQELAKMEATRAALLDQIVAKKTELQDMREDAEKTRLDMLPPADKLAALKKQLAEIFHAAGTGTSLEALQAKAAAQQRAGDTVGEKDTLGKLKKAQGLAKEAASLQPAQFAIRGGLASSVDLLLGKSGDHLILDETKKQGSLLADIHKVLNSIDKKTVKEQNLPLRFT